jgi:hypothetical protein
MKTNNITKAFLVFGATFILGACGGLPPAKDFSGDWQKINTFEPRVDTIPLEKEYFFTALKVDSSLMALLQRWANDVSLGLEVRCRNDYSVSEKMLDVQTRSLTAALEELNYIYSKQDLELSLNKETSFIVFSCGKNNKDVFLGDKQIKTIEMIKKLPFEGTRYEVKPIDASLKLNVTNEINVAPPTKVK